ncbi:S9 family peptidase [Wenzhouxiangella sp. XN79A]|uniref:S9 family peptidase n=1 Tax=Wenzhouxiangella sp. XN79A TaxID=2724193 RepID=UPI00144A61AD|nr:S9 family peptidase [Wenzhouxiangella sp. XN79A]NKI33816.1 S9 family peptidase [Wenzhouxiangella sp. XN79A]
MRRVEPIPADRALNGAGLGLVTLLCAALLLAVGPVHADGMTLEQIARLEQVGSVEVSPDGEHIAYTRSVPRIPGQGEDGPAWSELHVIDAGGESHAFITGKASVASIGWTPDSRHITFLAKREGDDARRLYAIPVDGGEARVLARLETDVLGYSFHPAGSQVALIAFEPDDEAVTALEEQGFDQKVYEEGLKFRRLWIVDLDDDQARPRMLELEASVQAVAWSPAGDRLAIRVTPRELVDDTLMFARIRIIDPAGESIGRIDNPGKLGDMAWSPSGDHLAFIGTNIVNDPREGRLLIADRNGGPFTDLLPGLKGHVWHLAWLSDRRLAYIAQEGVATRLGSLAPDGSNPLDLADPGPILTGLSIGQSRIAVTASSPTHPDELLERADDEWLRRTDSNPWLADVELARQQVVRYPARDGLEIEGLLIYPLDYRPGTRYPLILTVHGGPEAHYSNGWLTRYNTPGQHAASEGFFTFYPNYRGSTGRGVEFTLTSQGRPAMEEFDDLIDGVDHLIDEGLVDGDRVGITGGSYGGYATAWGATVYSERFAAAVMNVGLSDQIAAFGTSDIPWEFNLVHLRKWPWEDWELFRQASPLYHVTRAATPILILHGDADPRVDPTQSRMFYRFLKLQENAPPVRLVLYPGEGHGNQRAASRWDYSLRLMRWMKHYLTGEGGEPPPYRVDYRLADTSDE